MPENNNNETFTLDDINKLKDSYQTNLNKLNEENIALKNTAEELRAMPQIEKTFLKNGGKQGNAFNDFYNMNKTKLLQSKDLTADINSIKLEKDYFFNQEVATKKDETNLEVKIPTPTTTAANVGEQVQPPTNIKTKATIASPEF